MAERILTPANLARQAVSRLKSMANPVKARGGEKYFKHAVKLYGISSPDIRALASEYYQSIKGLWSVKDAVDLCDILFPEPELEAKAIGGLLLARFKKDFPKSLFEKVKGWLAADLLDNWASVDVFCTDAMGSLLLKYPELAGKIKSWPFHRNRWVKRASAVSFIKLAKREEFLQPIYEISTSLFPVEDDLIHKANGWLLREAGKRDMRRLERFLLAHGPAIPRTTLRYAIERFPEARRKVLLERTRAA